jgi:PII-like signaling protein
MSPTHFLRRIGGTIMQGYQLTFFTQQDRVHKHLPLGQWLIKEAKRLGIRGATLFPATKGENLPSAQFFELTDQLVEITMSISKVESEIMFSRLREENINIFYLKFPIEFGMTNDVKRGII